MPQCTCTEPASRGTILFTHFCEIHGYKNCFCARDLLEDGREVIGQVSAMCPLHKNLLPSQAAPSPITHPPHYTSHPSGIEAWTIAEAFSYHIGTAIAYLWRAEHKNGIEDLRKAIQHIEREILRLEKAPTP